MIFSGPGIQVKEVESKENIREMSVGQIDNAAVEVEDIDIEGVEGVEGIEGIVEEAEVKAEVEPEVEAEVEAAGLASIDKI